MFKNNEVFILEGQFIKTRYYYLTAPNKIKLKTLNFLIILQVKIIITKLLVYS